jgi:1-pyrroline-4-hydroxy-2-carboxylate deaminase
MTQWKGVYPAVTTHFKPDQSIDFAATAAHIERLLRAGMHGFIVLGTVGENCSLEADEKRQVLKLAVDTVKGRVPILAGVAEYTAALAGRYAVDAKKIGINGLMVLPPMVYKSAPRETLAHFRAVARASDLPIMVYNNPPAYGVDITPEMFAELASEPTIVAIKESSDDPRRLTDIINATGNRYTLFCGVDDLILESMVLGCVGWVSGLVNAFPEESVRLYDLVLAGRHKEALPLYRWFMPLLHLDIGHRLVQQIKLAQNMAGLGSELVRAPRLVLEGAEREQVRAIVQRALDQRPRLAA